MRRLRALTVAVAVVLLIDPRMRAAAAGHTETGSYRDDFTAETPAPGWSYWWNENGPLGDPAGYTALEWTGTSYGDPSAEEFDFGVVAIWGVHPGRGVDQGAAEDRYAIVRYTIPTRHEYHITRSRYANPGCSTDGIELQVLVNDVSVDQFVFQGSNGTFNQALGRLEAGDTVDIAVGPDGSSTCDGVSLDYQVEPVADQTGPPVLDFTYGVGSGTPRSGWSLLWNETGPVGDSSGYASLRYNGSFYNSTGSATTPSSDEFRYGRIAAWGAHPGGSTAQGAADDRYAIARFTTSESGRHRIVQSSIEDRDCTTGGVELLVLVNDQIVGSSVGVFSRPTSFDVDLGSLSPGDTIDVAVGPGDSDVCDAVDLDYFIEIIPDDRGTVVATFSEGVQPDAPAPGWAYVWNPFASIDTLSQHVFLVWNSIHYDSDGAPGPITPDAFDYGHVAKWGVHPGRGTSQGTPEGRFAGIRYSIPADGDYWLSDTRLADRGCASGGVELQVIVEGQVVRSQEHVGSTPLSFDTLLGRLEAGDRIVVAVGPGGSNVCDATELDFSVSLRS